MNKSELIKQMAKKSKLSQKDCSNCLDALKLVVEQALKNGDNVSLIGFGKFEVKYRSPRKAYNPYTKRNVILPASKVPTFKAGKNLKEAIYS